MININLRPILHGFRDIAFDMLNGHIWLPLLFNSPAGRVPLVGRYPHNFPWMSMDGQGTKCRKNIAENLNRLSRAHERYRRQTDRQTTDRRTGDTFTATAYSEREREFAFAKNQEMR